MPQQSVSMVTGIWQELIILRFKARILWLARAELSTVRKTMKVFWEIFKPVIAKENRMLSGLLTCWSVCVRRDFLCRENLMAYAGLAASYRVNFVRSIERGSVPG